MTTQGVPPVDAPPPLRAAIARCIGGETPPNVALMQMLIAASDPRDVEAGLERTMEALDRSGDALGVERLRHAAMLLDKHPEAPRLVREILAQVPHDEALVRNPDTPAFWAAAFDRAFDINPEAGVALYSLGDRDLLDVATAEIVRHLREDGIVGIEKHLLDLGCGFGRMAEALAPAVGQIIGIDVSERMVSAARARCGALENVHIILGDGRELPLPDESIDAAIAVDSFPYIVAGSGELVAAVMGEVTRVLKRGGALIAFNWSYRGDLDADEADVRAAAEAAGLVARPRVHVRFHTWDANVFRMDKPSE